MAMICLRRCRYTCSVLLQRCCSNSAPLSLENGNGSTDPKDSKQPIKDKFNFHLVPEVEKALNLSEYKPKHHPGITKQKTFDVPRTVHNAIEKILEEYPDKKLKTDGLRLVNVLAMRCKPVEKDEMIKKSDEILNEMEIKNPIDPYLDYLSEVDRRKILSERNALVHKKLKSFVNNWKPVVYDDYKCVLYLINRFPCEYAILSKIFLEIFQRVEDFKPRTVFDFGSGVGSVTWAVDNIWPGKCYEMLNFDPSEQMNNLADKVLRGGTTAGNLKRRDGSTIYRQFLPCSDTISYDLVVSSFSLLEVGDLSARVRAIDILWRKVAQGGCIVLIEDGQNTGYEIILQARSYLIHVINQELEAGGPGGIVLAPCSHELFCPRYLSSKTPCNFPIKYKHLYSSSQKSPEGTEFYSYLVIYRGNRETVLGGEWPRIVRNPGLQNKHVLLRTCTPDGELDNFTSTKKRHGSMCYKTCMSSNWGDLLPIKYYKTEEDSTNNEKKQESNTNILPDELYEKFVMENSQMFELNKNEFSTESSDTSSVNNLTSVTEDFDTISDTNKFVGQNSETYDEEEEILSENSNKIIEKTINEQQQTNSKED